VYTTACWNANAAHFGGWQGGYDQSDLPCYHFVESYCQLILLKKM